MHTRELGGQRNRSLRGIPQTTLRRLRNTPSYFFLLWRWAAWLYALIVIISKGYAPYPALAIFLLAFTFAQTLAVTLYAPVFRIFLPGLPRIQGIQGIEATRRATRPFRKLLGSGKPGQRAPAADEEADIVTPIARTRNPYWDFAIYGLDVVVCGLVMYFSGYYGNPHFGVGTPFYRYGISTALAAALSYRYRGGLAAAFGFELFVLLGIVVPPPHIPFTIPNAIDVAGSLIDAPVIAALAAYVARLLESYTRSKRREQDHARNQQALLHVSETLVKGARDRTSLLQTSAEQIRKGGHFERLSLAVVGGDEMESRAIVIDSHIEVGVVETTSAPEHALLLQRTAQTGEKQSTFTPFDSADQAGASGYQIARLALPIYKEGQLYLVLGAESRRQKPFEEKQEKFLRIAGTQLVVALENMRLVEQTVELAAEAERGRIAREIHDGVAQLVYMLSLNTETCAALAHRIAADGGEEQETLLPLAERLDKLVTISKQALWETRHAMFTLKPLLAGTSTLTQTASNQVREFEAISGLRTHLEVEGEEELEVGNPRAAQKKMQVATAIFRITQEALSNAYKHAGATEVSVYLRYVPGWIEVEICDNGQEAGDFDFKQQRDGARVYAGRGIPGMRDRAEELGGSLQVGPAPGGGLRVLARIPLVRGEDRTHGENTLDDRG